jgi:hypothetical protein
MKKLSALMTACCISIGAVADDQDQKINFIQNSLDNTAEHSKYWYNGFLGLFSGAAIAQATIYSVTDKEDGRKESRLKYDAKVGFITASLGAIDLLIAPMETHHYAEDLHQLPSMTSDEKSSKLMAAENMLQKAAKREKMAKGWDKHLGAFIVNATAGYFIATDDDRPAGEGAGIQAFLLGMAVSEFQIYSAPTSSIEAWDNYQAGRYDVAQQAGEVSPTQFYITQNGFGVNYRF